MSLKLFRYIAFICLLSTLSCVSKVQVTFYTIKHSDNVRMDGEASQRGSDPKDALNGNKGELKVPLIP